VRPPTSFEIRRSYDTDLPSVLALLRDCLGWASDQRHEAVFAWKHRDNPFGPSPSWVAFDGERLVGLRLLMRWEFEQQGRLVPAVRAVDTVTHPDYRGRGVFTALTLRAVDELRAEGIAFIFNTPNEQSRPGYVKMGWRVVGRLPVAIRPVSVRALPRILGARTPADRWSLPSTAGSSAVEVLRERTALESLLTSRPAPRRVRTRATPGYLAWRYGSPLLGYRVLMADAGVAEGVVIFRIRRRGRAREAVLCEVLVPGDDSRLRRRLLRRAAHAVDADYVIGMGGAAEAAAGLVPLPAQGPILTWRGLNAPRMPHRREWHLGLGDVELF